MADLRENRTFNIIKHVLLSSAVLFFSACTNGPSLQTNDATKDAAIASQGEELLFVGHDDGDLDIYLTNTHTGAVSKLTDNNRDDMHPAWSADGKQIAYASSEHGLYEIYVMNADGSNKRRITDNQASEITPQWSPDGESLVYVSDRDGAEQIYRYHFPTATETALTSSETGAIQPEYSHSGHRIAYLERDGKKLLLKTMHADGREQILLVEDLSIITMTWSPDSTQIAFSGRGKRINNLYSVDSESGVVSSLTDRQASDTSPVWLPSGESLIFLSSGDSFRAQAQIHRLDLNGNTEPVRLSDSGFEEMNIAVSKDGKKIGYVRYENRFFHTYVMDLDNGETEKMAAQLGRAQLTPSFRPSS